MREWYPASRVSGALAAHADGFADWLRGQGFSASAVSSRMWQFDRLSRWLEREGLGLRELTEPRVREFVDRDRIAGVAYDKSARTLRLRLVYLRQVRAVPPSVPSRGPVELLLESFGGYLAHERGLTAKNVSEYQRVVRRFVAAHERDGVVELEWLTPADVTAFVVRECPTSNVSEARQFTKGLRALLRYLHVAGLLGSSAPVVLRSTT